MAISAATRRAWDDFEKGKVWNDVRKVPQHMGAKRNDLTPAQVFEKRRAGEYVLKDEDGFYEYLPVWGETKTYVDERASYTIGDALQALAAAGVPGQVLLFRRTGGTLIGLLGDPKPADESYGDLNGPAYERVYIGASDELAKLEARGYAHVATYTPA